MLLIVGSSILRPLAGCDIMFRSSTSAKYSRIQRPLAGCNLGLEITVDGILAFVFSYVPLRGVMLLSEYQRIFIIYASYVPLRGVMKLKTFLPSPCGV